MIQLLLIRKPLGSEKCIHVKLITKTEEVPDLDHNQGRLLLQNQEHQQQANDFIIIIDSLNNMLIQGKKASIAKGSGGRTPIQ